MSVLEKIPDTVRELATQIYVGLVCRAYGEARPDEETRQSPEALARTSFKLAEAFHLADREVNPITIAAAAATKSAIRFDASDLDLGILQAQR